MKESISKSEARNPKEIRNPKSESLEPPTKFAWRLVRRVGLALWPFDRFRCSDFGFRISFGFRASGFGLLLALLTFNLQPSTSQAQGTAFTYQGRLNVNGSPAGGLYDLRFKMFVDPLANNQAGGTLLTNGVPVANGLFVVTLDFGSGLFNGSNYWLEVDVKTNGAGSYADLSPLQAITPTPYAIFAENVANLVIAAGTYSNAVTFNNAGDQFAGTFTGNGASISNVVAASLGGVSASGFWKTTGNAGTAPGTNFVGTTDNQPLELWVNLSRVLRLEPDTNNFGAPNIIGGSPANIVDPGIYGATIAGGGVLNYTTNGYEPGLGSNHVSAVWGTIGGGRRNVVAGDHGVIAGGHDNLIQTGAFDSAIGGGEFNVISSPNGQSTIAGGYNNKTANYGGVVGGGYFNSVNGYYATVGGGYLNRANGYISVVPGGYFNTAGGSYAIASGGYENSAAGDYSFAAGLFASAIHPGAFVWADSSAFANFYSTASNQFSVRATGGARFVTGGQGMTLDGPMQAASLQGNLDASYISSGTLPDARLSGNVALLNASLNTFAGDLSMSGGAAYHNLSLSGGNALGYLYASYPRWGDGIHLGYNYYADALGGNHVINGGGGTSRISVGYDSIVLATGGVGIQPAYQNVVINDTVTTVNGTLTVNGTFNNLSDRNAKQDFAPVSPSLILDKVAKLPVTEWSYREDATTRHIGPVAQDFFSLFNIGTDERHIAPIDEGGVALAAIQGLNEKLEVQSQNSESRIQKLEAENAELRARVRSLEEFVLKQNSIRKN